MAINQQGKVLCEWGNTPSGDKLLDFFVGEQPKSTSQFVGAAGIAFTADGYGNALSAASTHSIDVSAKGEILTGVRLDQLLWSKPKSQ